MVPNSSSRSAPATTVKKSLVSRDTDVVADAYCALRSFPANATAWALITATPSFTAAWEKGISSGQLRFRVSRGRMSINSSHVLHGSFVRYRRRTVCEPRFSTSTSTETVSPISSNPLLLLSDFPFWIIVTLRSCSKGSPASASVVVTKLVPAAVAVASTCTLATPSSMLCCTRLRKAEQLADSPGESCTTPRSHGATVPS
mmetsp:Transcript_23895/g.66893  ORF Transcript_23895/g.66893 Transcript_23895/m.66893 type:complete len:201 (-) Transcript_23895:2106-2708(-)